jgi:hypothetical protein
MVGPMFIRIEEQVQLLPIGLDESFRNIFSR